MNIYLLLFVVLFFLSPILGQVLEKVAQNRYSRSVVNMDDLLKLEEHLVFNLELYTAELVKKHDTILSGINMMRERHLLEAKQGTKKFWENPMNTYSLIRHMQSDWHMWHLYMQKPVGLGWYYLFKVCVFRTFSVPSYFAGHIAYMENIKPMMPQYRDFYDAAEGFRRMQWTYSLSAPDIAQGLLDGVQYNSSLTALDCFAMAEHLINGSRWSDATEWLMAGFLVLERPAPQPTIQELLGIRPALLLRLLAKIKVLEGGYKMAGFNVPRFCIVFAGDVPKALMAYKAALQDTPEDSALWQEFSYLERKTLILPGGHPARPEKVDPLEESKLPFCCNGQCDLPPKLRLYCTWNTQSHPFLRLAPIKTEFLSLDPHVVLLHDVVSKADRTLLRSVSKEFLLPSGTVNVQTIKYETAQFRTSKSVWYNSDTNNATKRITLLLEEATGLDLTRSEPFQVINYGVGGLFETHMDSLLPNEVSTINGIFDIYFSDFCIYCFQLSDVQQGGATVFNFLNLTVFPQPGSVLFWYNLDTRGNEHPYTSHAGCPVIVGSKWVMSKWIFDMGQEFRKPC
ncbi:hypothetical protein KR054_003106, partial [Drosophila jambulina]